MSKRRVVLIAGLADGRMAAEFLLKHPRIDLVGLFVLSEDAGKEVSGFLSFDDLADPPVLCKMNRIKQHIEEIKARNPDLIFIVGFSQIIPQALLGIAPLGVVGFHTALLPGRRGCSPVIWAIAEGLTETGVTMFFMDGGIDTGDVIATKKFSIEPMEDAADVLRKADVATLDLIRENLESLLDGSAPRVKQDDSRCTYTRKRTPADGEIDWFKPAQEIVNLIRALAPPYPMAHTFGGDGVPILVEKARVAPHLSLPSRFHKHPLRQTVLCVVAHPDDEVLGVGGTLTLHAQAGSEVIVLILSEGEDAKFSHTPHCPTRRESALKAAAVMGTKEVVFHDFPDQCLDTVPFIEIVKRIEEAITQFRPSAVYAHHPGDANTDHHVAFKATYAACRPMSRVGESVQRLLTFETPSSTDQAPQIGEFFFCPNCFVDVEPVWEKKVEALKCYPTEMIGGKHPRSFEYIEALARMRAGYAGYLLAEAFVLVRERVSRPVAVSRSTRLKS